MSADDTQHDHDHDEDHDEEQSEPLVLPLATRLAATLAPLGGRIALAARRFGPTRAHQANGLRTTDNDAFIHADDPLPMGALIALPITVELLRRADLDQLPTDNDNDNDNDTDADADDLAARMLAGDHDAGDALLDLLGVGEVNETLSRLNLTQTRLSRRYTDYADLAARPGTVTTAREMLALLSLARGNALPGAAHLRRLLASSAAQSTAARSWLPPEAARARVAGVAPQRYAEAGMLTGPNGDCLYCFLAADQPDTTAVQAIQAAADSSLHTLWSAWCA